MSQLPEGFDRIRDSHLKTEETGIRPGPKNEDVIEAPDFSDLNTENKGFFAKLGEKSKEWAGWAYEGIKKTPLLGKLVGKAQIAFHEGWMNRHHEKAEGLKGRIMETDNKIKEMDSSHADITSALEELRGQNVPNLKSLEEKLRAIEMNKNKLVKSKEGFQGKLDKRNEKIEMRTKKRDAVVDEFIERTNEKLAPIDKKMEGLNSKKNQTELKASMAEVRYRKQIEGLDKQQAAKEKIENALKKIGMSKLEIEEDPDLVRINTAIIEGKKEINKSKAAMDKERKDISDRTKKTDSKAKGYRDKVTEFKRIKEGRPAPVRMDQPIEAPVEEREGGSVANESRPESRVEAGTEEFPVKAYIKLFNTFLEETFRNNHEPEVIDEKKFAEATKGIKELEMDAYIQFKEFENIIPNYLNAIGVKSERIGYLMKDFYSKKIVEPENSAPVVEEKPEADVVDKVEPRFEQPKNEPVAPESAQRDGVLEIKKDPEVKNLFRKEDGKLESKDSLNVNGFSSS